MHGRYDVTFLKNELPDGWTTIKPPELKPVDEKVIDEIDSLANKLVEIFSVEKKLCLKAAINFKAEELNRDLSALIELVDRSYTL